MTRPRRLLLLVAVSIGLGCGSGQPPALDGWGKDLAEARKQAAAQKRPLAILYSAAWSRNCRKFEEGALKAPKVVEKLNGFERVRVEVASSKDMVLHGVSWVPTLILESPAGEVLKLEEGAYPADYLETELERLGEWKALDGWESDPAVAEKAAAASGKPLAVLYSGAWKKDAVQYEEKELAKIRDQLAARYTLLRLNYAANRDRAQQDGVKKAQDIPVLRLPLKGGEHALIPGRHDAELVSSFIRGLSKYQESPAGWSSDPALIREVRSGRKGMPMVILLDKAAHWESHRFLHDTLRKDEVSGLLDPGFVRVRLEFRKDLDLAVEFGVQEADLPCLLIFNNFGEYRQKCNYRTEVQDIVNELRLVGGRAEPG